MPPLVTEEEVILSILPNMETSGTIEFKMDKKSYRMVPLANSEDYLYNKNSLDRARKVCFGSVCIVSSTVHAERPKFKIPGVHDMGAEV